MKTRYVEPPAIAQSSSGSMPRDSLSIEARRSATVLAAGAENNQFSNARSRHKRALEMLVTINIEGRFVSASRMSDSDGEVSDTGSVDFGCVAPPVAPTWI